MKLHRISLAAFACVLLLGACQQDGGNGPEDDEEETPPVPVETSKPVRGDVFAVYSGTAPIEAFAEAGSYNGPSLIIAYSHCIAHGIPMNKGM